MHRQIIYEKAIKYWGKELQVGMLTEEVSELLIAVNKFRRNDTAQNHFNIVEEIADVRIMLEQIMFLFKITERMVTEREANKLKKLEKMVVESQQ